VDYHLSIAGERSGPHTQFHIIEGIRDERLKGDELIWRLGMDGWQPLRSMREFEDFWPITEAAREQAEAARKVARTELDRPRPWLRFWARMLDYMWFFLFVLTIVGPWLPKEPPRLEHNPFLSHLVLDLFVLVPMLLYVPVEAWLLSKFGSTPGRALLRVQVRRLDGGLPTFTQALSRSFQVCVKGLALGLPLVYLIAMWWSRIMLVQRGVSSWDESAETRVEHGEAETWRYLVLFGIILGVAITVVVAAAGMAEMSHLPK
jgi:uncharacterized RDD family membrane protein YckC